MAPDFFYGLQMEMEGRIMKRAGTKGKLRTDPKPNRGLIAKMAYRYSTFRIPKTEERNSVSPYARTGEKTVPRQRKSMKRALDEFAERVFKDRKWYRKDEGHVRAVNDKGAAVRLNVTQRVAYDIDAQIHGWKWRAGNDNPDRTLADICRIIYLDWSARLLARLDDTNIETYNLALLELVKVVLREEDMNSRRGKLSSTDSEWLRQMGILAEWEEQ